MRASKENAEKTIQTVKKLLNKTGREPKLFGPGDKVANRAVISRFENEILNFLKAAKAKLPSDKAYEDDRKRRRARSAAN
jgi:hypothetical protein